jgi:hypothetical protein
MSLLFKVIMAARCSSTHHKLAIDALRHLRGHDAERWRNLFLKYHEAYLKGSKAPDKTFRDFKNHVIHVRENYWGGAVQAASQWFGRTVDALRRRDWEQAVFAAGVLSHYYTDPIQPFHTGQTEEEGSIHRAAEWSIAKSYEELREILEHDLGGYPKVEVPGGDDWLAAMVRQGAEKSNPHYQAIIDHYDLDQGVKNPPLGLDQELRQRIAGLMGYAAVGLARILEGAFQDARVAPPITLVTLHGFLAALKIPIFWVSRKLADRRERAVVEMIYEEVRRTGKAVVLLPDDDRAVRRMHAEEVLNVSIETLNARKARRTGTQHGRKSPPHGVPRRPRNESPRHVAPVLDRQETGERTRTRRPADQGAGDCGEFERSRYPRHATGLDDLHPSGGPPPRSVPATRERQAPRRPANLGTTSLSFASHDDGLDSESHAEDAEERPGRGFEYTERKPARAFEQTEGSRRRASGPADESKKRAPEFYLDPTRPVVDAPSIGSKTAKRLRAVGIRTVSDLLEQDPAEVAPRLGKRWITPATIRDWQAQASLVCRVPGLRGHDAQILVGCGITEPHQLARQSPEALLSAVQQFAESAEGQRILWSGKAPDLEEVRDWIRWADQSRSLRAA